MFRASENGFQMLYDGYASSLRWVLGRQPLVLGVTLGTICLAVYLYIVVPKGFFPQQDNGRLNGSVVASEDISFQSMRQKLAQYVELVKSDPAVDVVTGFVGQRVNVANLNITLKPLEERKISADQVINRLRPKLARVPGATLFLQAVQDVTIGGRAGNAQYQYTLQGDNLPDLLNYAPQMLDKMRALPQLRDVNTDLQNRGLQAWVGYRPLHGGPLGAHGECH